MGFLNGDASLYSEDVSWMIGAVADDSVHATPGSQTLELDALRPFPPPFTARLELNMPRALTMLGGSFCLEHQPSCRRPLEILKVALLSFLFFSPLIFCSCSPMARTGVLKQLSLPVPWPKKKRKKKKIPQAGITARLRLAGNWPLKELKIVFLRRNHEREGLLAETLSELPFCDEMGRASWKSSDAETGDGLWRIRDAKPSFGLREE